MNNRLGGLLYKILGKAFDKLRSIDLRRKILLIISFTVLVIIVFCFALFNYTSTVRNSREKELNLRNYFVQSENQLNAYLEQIDFIAHTVMFSSWVQQLINSSPSSLTEQLLLRTNVQRFLQSLSSINGNISMVLITDKEWLITNSTLRYNYQYNIGEQPWFEEFLKTKKHIEYGNSSLFSSLNSSWSMTRYYTVNSLYNFDIIGYFAINIPVENFLFLLSDSQFDWIKVNASNGAVILDNPSDFLSPGIPIRGLPGEPGVRKWASYEDTLMEGHWDIKLYRHLSIILLDEIKNYYLFFILLVPILGLFILITLLFSGYLTNPIVRCRNAMLEIQNNNFGITLENHYRDEIGGLISGFNEMSSTLVTLRQRNTEIEKLRREAEIDILQQKVNPHFLYNTLEIINGLILDGQYSEAVQVCEILGQLYHYNLMNSKWIKLKDECEYVKRYLTILRHKMNNLSVIWETDDGAMETDFLKLILQPLVENACLHGLRSRQDDACLTITVGIKDTKTEILIMDNGCGIEAAALAEIEKTLSAVRSGITPANSHIGIANVYQRLYLEYGTAMDFVIESRPGYGTKFIIHLPGGSNGK